MQCKVVGKTGLSLSRIGVGAWAMGGGGWAYSWGPQDDKESIAAIHAALDVGINWIDTAPVYGLGHSEEVVARALAGLSPRPYVFTKCGMTWNERGEISRTLKKDSIRREIENSLRRLRVDTIDLYQIHWPDPDSDIEEAWGVLARLRDEGKVRHIGVCNFSVSQIERVQSTAPVSTIQPPYSLLARQSENQLVPYAAGKDIAVISYSPMKSGLLSGAMSHARIAALPPDDFRRSAGEFREPRLSRNLQLVEVLREIGRNHNCSPAEIAIAWVLRNPAITGAIVGVRSAGQVAGIIRAAEVQLEPAELQRLQTFLGGMRSSFSERMVENMKTVARRVLGR